MEIKRVYEKLNKVELKSEKIELALVDDLRTLQKKIDKALSDEIKLRTEATKLYGKAKQLDKDFNKIIVETKTKTKEFSKKSKELGVDEPAFIDSLYDAFSINILDNIKREFR